MNASVSKATRNQALFISTLREFENTSKDILRTHGVTSMQYRAMLVIATAETDKYLSMNGLAAKLNVRHNSAVGLVNRLEAAGFVLRRKSPMDRRVASLSLTEKGAQVLEQLSDAHNTGLKRVSPQIHGVVAASA